MPAYLILGATGYLGSFICQHLLDNGHTVYGLARSASKAGALAKQEIIPVIGSTESPQGISDALDQHPDIAAVVDAAAVYGESVKLLQLIMKAGEARLKRFGSASVPGGVSPKLGYVYVSGMWVHGSSKAGTGVYASDVNPLTGDMDKSLPSPVAMVGWRPEIERLILSDDTRKVLDTAIVRPACMYGGASAIWSGPLFAIQNAVKAGGKSVDITVEPGSTPSLSHVSDVGAAVTLVIEKLPLIAHTGVYPIFNVVGQVEALQGIFEGAARVMGFKGEVKLVGPAEGDVVSDAIAASVVGDSSRLKTLLGWTGPKRKGFLQGIDAYVKAWEAASAKA